MKVNQIRAGAIVSYITIFFNILSGFIYTPWLIDQLGQSDYALYTLVTSVMTYFVLDFGMGAAITRFVTKYRATGEKNKIYQLLGVTTKLYLLLDAIVLIALVVVYPLLDNIYVNLTAVELERLRVIYIIAGTMSVLSFPFLPLNGIFTAYEKLYAQKLFDLAAKVCTVASVVVALCLGKGLYAVILFNAIITFLMHILKFAYITKSEHLRIHIKHRDKSLLKNIFGFSFWVMLSSIADRFFFTFIPSLLSIVSNSVQVAVFGVALSVENYTCLFASTFSNLFLPRVTKMVVNKENPEVITDLMIKVGRIQLIVVSAIVTLMVSMGQEFIHCWVGDDYRQSYIVLVLILIPTLISFTQTIAGEMIYATNNVKYRTLVYVLGSIVSTIITLLLGNILGAIGAAIGIFVALVLSRVIVSNVIYKKVLKLNILRFFKECHLKMLVPLLISGGIGYGIMRLFPVDSLVLFLIKAALWGVIHLTIVWFMILNPYEKSLVKDFLNKFKRN